MIEKKKLNIKEIKELLEQLNNAFKIMYINSIIHRNIKPENILIKKLKNKNNLYFN
jgi:serine/threonine protein kinase